MARRIKSLEKSSLATKRLNEVKKAEEQRSTASPRRKTRIIMKAKEKIKERIRMEKSHK